jgi:hypothetical protein
VSVGHWRNRLPPGKRRVYDRSDGITSIPLAPTRVLQQVVRDLETALGRGNRRAVGELSQRVADDVCASLRVPSLRVLVQGRRPSSDWGELHGLYTPGTNHRRDTVKVWMITAKRGQVVAFRTFLRTLVHELCHHLDYTFFALPDSLHSDGFYIRESGMMRRLMGEPSGRSRQASSGNRPAPGAGTPVLEALLPAPVR